MFYKVLSSNTTTQKVYNWCLPTKTMILVCQDWGSSVLCMHSTSYIICLKYCLRWQCSDRNNNSSLQNRGSHLLDTTCIFGINKVTIASLLHKHTLFYSETNKGRQTPCQQLVVIILKAHLFCSVQVLLFFIRKTGSHQDLLGRQDTKLLNEQSNAL